MSAAHPGVREEGGVDERVHKMRTRVVQRWLQVGTARAFARWLQVTGLRRVARTLVRRWRSALIASAFVSWMQQCPSVSLGGRGLRIDGLGMVRGGISTRPGEISPLSVVSQSLHADDLLVPDGDRDSYAGSLAPIVVGPDDLMAASSELPGDIARNLVGADGDDTHMLMTLNMNLQPPAPERLREVSIKRGPNGGLGIVYNRLNPEHGPYFIVNMVLGSAAAQSGLVQVNDVLHAIDGNSVYEMDVAGVRAMISGAPGKEVVLSISRASAALEMAADPPQTVDPFGDVGPREVADHSVPGSSQIHAEDDDAVERVHKEIGPGRGSTGRTKLIVRLIRALHLPKTDRFGSCDGYVTLSLGSQHFRSKTIKNSYAPEWDQTFTFDVQQPSDDTLVLAVYDWNRVHRDEQVGLVRVPIASLGSGELSLGVQHVLPVMRDATGAATSNAVVTGHDGNTCSLVVILDRQVDALGEGGVREADDAVGSRAGELEKGVVGESVQEEEQVCGFTELLLICKQTSAPAHCVCI